MTCIDAIFNLLYFQHGRIKVKTTAEQQEAKRKEREKKLKIYTGATERVFLKVKLFKLFSYTCTLYVYYAATVRVHLIHVYGLPYISE